MSTEIITKRRICVYCGSKSGINSSYAEAVKELGAILNDRSYGLVYGGGRIGLMGTIADTVLKANSEVIGVIPEDLLQREVGHNHLTELKVVQSMHKRKEVMADLSDAFIALPGGLGTFEELFEILTWSQLGLHQKPVGLLNIDGYYDTLLSFLDQTVEKGFMNHNYREFITVEENPAKLIDAFETILLQED